MHGLLALRYAGAADPLNQKDICQASVLLLFSGAELLQSDDLCSGSEDIKGPQPGHCHWTSKPRNLSEDLIAEIASPEPGEGPVETEVKADSWRCPAYTCATLTGSQKAKLELTGLRLPYQGEHLIFGNI